MEDYYRILGVRETAGEDEIKHAFRRLVKQYHPDSLDPKSRTAYAEQRFLKLTEAYEVLSDPERRSHYDRERRADGRQKTPGRKESEKFYREGRRAYKSEQYARSSALFRGALERSPDTPLYCSWLGLSLARQRGLFAEAVKWCERAIVLNPSNSDYYVNLALVYREAGRNTLALKHAHKAILIDPSNKRARLWLERLHGRKENPFLRRLRSFLSLRTIVLA